MALAVDGRRGLNGRHCVPAILRPRQARGTSVGTLLAYTAFARVGGIVWQTSRLIGGACDGFQRRFSGGQARTAARGGTVWRTLCCDTARDA